MWLLMGVLLSSSVIASCSPGAPSPAASERSIRLEVGSERPIDAVESAPQSRGRFI